MEVWVDNNNNSTLEREAKEMVSWVLFLMRILQLTCVNLTVTSRNHVHQLCLPVVNHNSVGISQG